MVNTLVYKPLVYKGFQWLLYNGTPVVVYIRMGIPCVQNLSSLNYAWMMNKSHQFVYYWDYSCLSNFSASINAEDNTSLHFWRSSSSPSSKIPKCIASNPEPL
jgi:hypothetical protein